MGGDARSDAPAVPWPRWLFWLAVAFGASVFWIADHPPMADLAQHSGQVALWRDLILGRSAWADLVRINLLTPYLLGYGLALPLSFVLPLVTAFKVLLTVAYLAFVLVSVRLRQHHGADERLDPLFLFSFLGYAYKWGLITFMMAAPVVLLLLLLASKQAQAPTLRRGLAVAGLAVALLFSHGLAFLFAVGTGLAYALWGTWQRRGGFWPQVAPYLLPLAGFVALFAINRLLQAEFKAPYDYVPIYDWGWKRIPKAMIYIVGSLEDKHLLPLGLALLAMPFVMGLRPRWRLEPRTIPVACLLVLLLAGPSFALDTALLWERFCLYLPPLWALAFVQPASRPAPRWQPAAARLLFALCLVLPALQAHRAWRFDLETRELNAGLRSLEPNQRLVMMAYEFHSHDAQNPVIYMQYGAWYQAERGGFVDYNFAWFPPQVVRFKPDKLPPVNPGFEWKPWRFEWNEFRGGDYRYFLVYRAKKTPEEIFKGAPCMPKVKWTAHDGWVLYERVDAC
ncbi:hypothetical protein [Aquabacterium sp. J223]|uniref:hypothetical protein n=1 Tax=Aquabacterium sp. J223 TaxID=2898431 RepID=UPI0021ADDF47|nr:hypothetical protein [Aquabacterium sp. J223]UUX94304.1 hypothetical protein LRS07_13310 [Aquabacterium sp. J223]